MSYTTIQGQTWDQIAKEVYGGEKYTDFLMSNNRKQLDIFLFPAGVVLNTPGIPMTSSTLPPWRTR